MPLPTSGSWLFLAFSHHCQKQWHLCTPSRTPQLKRHWGWTCYTQPLLRVWMLHWFPCVDSSPSSNPADLVTCFSPPTLVPLRSPACELLVSSCLRRCDPARWSAPSVTDAALVGILLLCSASGDYRARKGSVRRRPSLKLLGSNWLESENGDVPSRSELVIYFPVCKMWVRLYVCMPVYAQIWKVCAHVQCCSASDYGWGRCDQKTIRGISSKVLLLAFLSFFCAETCHLVYENLVSTPLRNKSGAPLIELCHTWPCGGCT